MPDVPGNLGRRTFALRGHDAGLVRGAETLLRWHHRFSGYGTDLLVNNDLKRDATFGRENIRCQSRGLSFSKAAASTKDFAENSIFYTGRYHDFHLDQLADPHRDLDLSDIPFI